MVVTKQVSINSDCVREKFVGDRWQPFLSFLVHSLALFKQNVSSSTRTSKLEGKNLETHSLLLCFTTFDQDLGKSSNDLLSKDYPIHGTSLEVKTKTPSNVTFKVAGNTDSKTNHISGDVEAKYVDPKNGFTVTQGWTTTNVLKTNFEIENQIAKGLKFEINTSLHPDKGTKHGLLSTVYKQPGLHTRAFLDVFKVDRVPFSQTIFLKYNRDLLSLLTLSLVVMVSFLVPRELTMLLRAVSPDMPLLSAIAPQSMPSPSMVSGI